MTNRRPQCALSLGVSLTEWSPERWPSQGWPKERKLRSPPPADFTADTSAAPASHVDKGKPNVPGTSLAVGTAVKPASSAATPMVNERSLNGQWTQLTGLWTAMMLSCNRQLASLSAKVQAYENVIKKLSNRFGVSDEHLMSIALTVVSRAFVWHTSLLIQSRKRPQI